MSTDDVAVSHNAVAPSALDPALSEAIKRAVDAELAPLKRQIDFMQRQIDFMFVRNFLGSRDLFKVFHVAVKDIEKARWQELIREETPDVYKCVCDPVLHANQDGHDRYSVASENSGNSGRQFSDEGFPTVFNATLAHAESAHLLSAGKTCWPYFAFSAVAFLGKEVYDKVKDWIEDPKENLDKSREDFLYGLINGVKVNESKKANSGLKNSIVNRIRLPLQGTYFDKQPRVMFLPILTMKAGQLWNGEGYRAIFLVNTTDESNDLPQIVAASVGILDESRLLTLQGVADKDGESELALFARACEFLKSMILGLVYNTAHFQPDERLRLLTTGSGNRSQPEVPPATHGKPPKPVSSGQGPSDFLETAKKLRTDEAEIPVPSVGPNCEDLLRELTLLVVDFGNQDEAKKKEKPLAPDPMLLGMKSAVNFLRFHGNLRILPACLLPNDVESVNSSDSAALSDGIEIDLEALRREGFFPVHNDSSASVPDVVAITPTFEIDDNDLSEDELWA